MDEAHKIDLKVLREDKGLSFKELSEALGISENFYRKIERQVVSLTAAIAEKLSSFYQIKIEPYFIDSKIVEIKHRKKKPSVDGTKNNILNISSDSISPTRTLNGVLKRKNMNLAKQLTKLYKTLTEIEQVISDAEIELEEDVF